jgi:hypothetical protein
MIDKNIRMPIRFLPQNQELLKSLDAGQRRGGTDYNNDTKVPEQSGVKNSYRTPVDRVNGNTAFRRLPNGQLDYDYACQQVVDAIRKQKDGVALTSQEQAICAVCYPSVFSSYMDPAMVEAYRDQVLKCTPEECLLVALKVGAHLHAQVEFMLSSHAR